MRGNVRNQDYVGTPGNLSIKVEYIPQRAGNKITFFIDNAPAFSRYFRTAPVSDKRYMHDFTTQICNMFFRTVSEEIFANSVADKDYLKAKYIYRTIQAVSTKAGVTIWTR
jgi:hypothetical protein